MKNITYLFLFVVLMLYSCSHTAIYRETVYDNEDPTYPAQALQFAYDGRGRVSSSIANAGNRIHQKVVADSSYNTYLASATKYEHTMNNSLFTVGYYVIEKDIAESENEYQKYKSSSNHSTVINKLTERLEASHPSYNTATFKDYWKRVYQLSHRGIIQYYMIADADYKRLSDMDKAFLYGYLLKKDIPECNKLAEEKMKNDSVALSSIREKMRAEIAYRKLALQRIEERKKAEEERRRREREAEERARQERIEREKARQRWNDDSWMDGRWNLRGVLPGWSCTVYIDTDRQTIKMYTRQIGDFSYPKPDYNGRYTMETRTYRGRRCKYMSFGDTFIIVLPDEGKLVDDGDYYWSGPYH